jgi:glucokinase
MLRNRAAQIGTLVDHNPARVTPEVILRAAEAGDDDARAILLESGYMLGIGVANLVTILSPDCVVIGGSVSGLGEWLFGPVREAVKQRCRAIPVAKVLIVPAALGGDAGVVGAAVWASQYYPNNK